jgi:Mg-chelatase subunit ChlD
MVSLALAIVMLANPQGSVEENYKVQLAYRIVAVIDKSGSMWQDDKMAIARKSTLDFFAHRPKDLVAILPFADSALFGEGTPFTADKEYVKETTSAIEANGGGTAIGDGILGGVWYMLRDIYVSKKMKESGVVLPSWDMLRSTLMQEKPEEHTKVMDRVAREFGALEGSFIVIVTDGESNSGINVRSAIEFAAGLRIPVYVIGIGGDVKVRPEFAPALESGGGAYFHSASPADIALMYQRIDELKPTRIRTEVVVRQHSFRTELALVVCFFLGLALLSRGAYLVVE